MEGRTANSLRNLKYGLLNTLMTSLLPFITRTVFIRVLGRDYLGVDSVFLNVINLLDIVNIGIGSAITYSVYKPIAQGNTEKCRTLFRLYRLCYCMIGAIVFVAGLCLLPFLDGILKNKPNIPESIYAIYLIILFGAASGYFFADKQCILNAHQQGYIISKTRMAVICVINVVEIVLLLLTRQYLVYLAVQTCQNLAINIIVHIKAKKLYPQFFGGRVEPLEKSDRQTIVKNTVALIFNRAGSLIINCTDSLIISSQVGVGSSGLYSNYLVLKNMVNTFTSMFTQSLTASIGNLNASDRDKTRLAQVFSQTYFINYLLHSFCAVCLFCLMEPFIFLWVGEEYCMGVPIAAIVTANFYFLGVQKTAEQFKSACGLYWQDRYRVFIEAMMNLVISLILVRSLGVLGVLLGTLISNLCVTFWVEPLIVFKHGLNRPVMPFLLKNLLYALLTAVVTWAIWTVDMLLFPTYGGIGQFILRAALTALLAVAVLCALFFRTAEFKATWALGMKILNPFLKRLGVGKR